MLSAALLAHAETIRFGNIFRMIGTVTESIVFGCIFGVLDVMLSTRWKAQLFLLIANSQQAVHTNGSKHKPDRRDRRQAGEPLAYANAVQLTALTMQLDTCAACCLSPASTRWCTACGDAARETGRATCRNAGSTSTAGPGGRGSTGTGAAISGLFATCSTRGTGFRAGILSHDCSSFRSGNLSGHRSSTAESAGCAAMSGTKRV